MNRILLADDDVEFSDMLTQYLAAEGFIVDTARDGKAALDKAETGHYDLIILDVMMPHMSGFDVLRALRARVLTPVLMLTARGEDVDSIIGLELGADDYLAKPCNPRVLLARIRAILRRSEDGGGTSDRTVQVLIVGDVEMRLGARQAYCRGAVLTLTSTEFSVLEVLLRDAGRVVAKATLSERALGRKLGRYDRSLDMHVANLRRKLGESDLQEERIKTVRGVGYQYTRPHHA